ncbi:hypothetical protein ACROYT_G014531 [Oculina patagonica]
MVYSQAQLEEKIIQSTDLMSQSYQICLEIYQTPKVDIIIKLDDFKKQLPTADLDVVEEEFEKSLLLFTEIKKMISEERKHISQQQEDEAFTGDISEENKKFKRGKRRSGSSGSWGEETNACFRAIQEKPRVGVSYFDLHTQSHHDKVLKPVFGVCDYWYRYEFAKTHTNCCMKAYEDVSQQQAFSRHLQMEFNQ